MNDVKLCLFSATPDMNNLGFFVNVLTGSPVELVERALAWGYDGIEFMPDPERIPDPVLFERELKNTGAVMPVVNTGRFWAQGLPLLVADPASRTHSLDAFKRVLDFAGYFRARVGLGAARGPGIPGPSESDRLTEEVFRELAEHAEKAGTVIMLEPSGHDDICIKTMDQAMKWVARIASPMFTVMLDTYQLATTEASIESGIRAACRRARHIHLFDADHRPPGVFAYKNQLDWDHIVQLLAEEGFSGSGSVVPPPDGDRESGARQCAAFLRHLLLKGGTA